MSRPGVGVEAGLAARSTSDPVGLQDNPVPQVLARYQAQVVAPRRGQLDGLTGILHLNIDEDGAHRYELEYAL